MLAEVTARQQIIAALRDGEHPDLIQCRAAALASPDRRLTPDHPDVIEAATYPETISSAAETLNRPLTP